MEFNSKLIGAIFVIVLVVAIGAYAVVYMTPTDENTTPTKTTDNEGDTNTTEAEVILSVVFASDQVNYTLEDLQALENTSGTGRMLKTGALPTIIFSPDINESGYSFTGVEIETLLMDAFSALPEVYNVSLIASDDWTTNFTKDQITGNVTQYDEEGNEIENVTNEVFMVVAYEEDGTSIVDTEDGPLRVVFIGEDTPITPSNLWTKMIVTIEIDGLFNS